MTISSTKAEQDFGKALQNALLIQDDFWDALEDLFDSTPEEKDAAQENFSNVIVESNAAWASATDALNIWNKVRQD
jgi:hypothetical protein